MGMGVKRVTKEGAVTLIPPFRSKRVIAQLVERLVRDGHYRGILIDMISSP